MQKQTIFIIAQFCVILKGKGKLDKNVQDQTLKILYTMQSFICKHNDLKNLVFWISMTSEEKEYSSIHW